MWNSSHTFSSASFLNSQVPGSTSSLVGFVGDVNVGILMHPKEQGWSRSDTRVPQKSHEPLAVVTLQQRVFRVGEVHLSAVIFCSLHTIFF